jgi:hypothetical protein
MRQDIRNMVFPDALSRDRPPRGLGSKRHGTLKAAQWRSICCFTLLVTLARHWNSKDASQLLQESFKNFVDLSTVVRIAYLRSITPAIIDEFELRSASYISRLTNIFPPEYIKQSHHYFLHISQFLRRFGPIPGWWAFSFERYNGFVQRTKTNHKPGRSITFFKSPLTGIQVKLSTPSIDEWIDCQVSTGFWSRAIANFLIYSGSPLLNLTTLINPQTSQVTPGIPSTEHTVHRLESATIL